jgi:hypothetical protein
VINAFCCSPLKQEADGTVVGDEGFYSPELHSIHEDERALHVPVCSLGARKKDWEDFMGVGGSNWSVASLTSHIVEFMEEKLGSARARRVSFDKQSDLQAWYTDQTLISGALHTWGRFPDDAELVHRNTHRDRIDRLMWKIPKSLKEFQRCVWLA